MSFIHLWKGMVFLCVMYGFIFTTGYAANHANNHMQ